MKNLRVGIIGLGRISILHLDAIKVMDNVQLVACCDINPQKVSQLKDFPDTKFFTDYKEMIDQVPLDAIHICLPHYLHTDVSIYAIERGVNVLTEKPMAIDYESAEKVVELAERKNVLYSVVFQCRYKNSIKFVKNALNQNKLGKILGARSFLTWNRDDSYYQDDWHGRWSTEGGGVIINQCIHSIDLVDYLIGSNFVDVKCRMTNYVHSPIEVEDTAEGVITYENGARYIFYATNNYCANSPIQLELVCEKGVARFNYDSAEIQYSDGNVERSQTQGVGIFDAKRKQYWGNQHSFQITQFYNSILGKEELEITGRTALHIHKLICEIYKKGKENFKKF